uniref:Molybdate transporter n=1 Tax=Alkalihalobacillus alcalophilus ATCC 27647 = CGMCC 1.3604 TaxID=1218173 RepID=J8TKF6_ALKAL|nr:molybdate transporter [Alkalihalobacillus alcalophilus ATCC 27647 = CGMCC 1.3604]
MNISNILEENLMKVVQLKDVSFRRWNRLILNKINWHVQKGEHWVLLGLNGSGKTSLLKLITGYEWASGGEITVLNERFGQTNIHELRKTIGWVSSSLDERFAARASDTTLEVVLSGRHASVGLYEDMTDEDKEAALQFLRLLKMENYKDSAFHTLSQGEKRRTMIARALMSEPKILILDEATASIDTETELKIQQGLKKLLHNRTAVMIAHRLSTIRDSDKIIVLDHGDVMEQGTHNELMDKKGIYYELVKSQYSAIHAD